ncbi:RNA 2',3'-cyclic phosphodiesterase [Komagataeibacter medellinensis]|uniref:RNA 2',3'-cyclic phosphodiesterase n=1 Tax=Komagataeibacter medellinensis TaxID=1177712 RepID=A0ABQ6VTE6_9PROT|nr:RNA 2',3'-cyclic phosphodiesterase [Komagataeibacter medellinensis]KAB8123357.1 RNA 2',3'-cyclic phosphodiesterase [Komagataeibacter medellinensis]
MRLFVGLELPPSVTQALDTLRGSLPGAAWIEPESWHLTLHFIGDVTQPHLLEEIHHSLAAVHAARPTLELTVPGLSETHGRPTGDRLWVGCAPTPALLHLHNRIRAVINRALPTLSPTSRRFMPHITIGSVQNPDPALRQRWLTIPLSRPDAETLTHFTLFRSIRHAGDTFYEALEHYPLQS